MQKMKALKKLLGAWVLILTVAVTSIPPGGTSVRADTHQSETEVTVMAESESTQRVEKETTKKEASEVFTKPAEKETKIAEKKKTITLKVSEHGKATFLNGKKIAENVQLYDKDWIAVVKPEAEPGYELRGFVVRNGDGIVYYPGYDKENEAFRLYMDEKMYNVTIDINFEKKDEVPVQQVKAASRRAMAASVPVARAASAVPSSGTCYVTVKTHSFGGGSTFNVTIAGKLYVGNCIDPGFPTPKDGTYSYTTTVEADGTTVVNVGSSYLTSNKFDIHPYDRDHLNSAPPWRTQRIQIRIPKPATGDIKIHKVSANTSLTSGNSWYKLGGAVYGVYHNGKLVQKRTTDSNGYARFEDLQDGVTYQVKEISNPCGYKISGTSYNFKVVGGQTKTGDVIEYPMSDPVNVLIKKVDAETGSAKPVSGQAANWGEARFTVKFYAGRYDAGVDPAKKGVTPTKTWVLKPNSNGQVELRSEACKVSGPLFYRDTDNRVVFPLGTVTIQETTAPKGYQIDKTVHVRRITSQGVDGGGQAMVSAIPSDGVQINEAPITVTFRKDVGGFGSDGSDPDAVVGATFKHTYTEDGKTKTMYYTTFAFKDTSTNKVKYGYKTKTTENGDYTATYWTEKPGVFYIYSPTQGSHSVQEVEAPSGQKINPRVIRFSVSGHTTTNQSGEAVAGDFFYQISDNGNAYYVVKNQPKKYQVRIRKVDEDGKPRAGAVFTMYADKALTQVVKSKTSDADGYMVWNDRTPNRNTAGETSDTSKKYYLVETQPPEGCTIPVDKYGKPHVYTVYCNMLLNKKTGAITTAYYVDGKRYTIDDNNSQNDIYISKTKDSDGDVIATINARVENPLTPPYVFNVIKKDENGKVLPGAEFTAYKDAALTQTVTGACEVTREDGIASLTGFKHNYDAANIKNVYYITETQPPEGYMIPTNADGSKIVHTFYTIATRNNAGSYDYAIYVDGKLHKTSETDATKDFYFSTSGQGILNVNMNAVNYLAPDYNFEVIKKDNENKPLSGVEFKLYSDADRQYYLATGKTGADGKGVFTGSDGKPFVYEYNFGDTIEHKYYFAETKTLPGYILPVDANNEPVVHEFYAKAKLQSNGTFAYEFYKDGKLYSTTITDATKDVFFSIENEKDVTMNVNLVNTPVGPYNFNVIKVGEDGELLAGAEFTVYSDKACTQKVTSGITGSDGKLKLEGFKHNFDASNIQNKYYITETKAPNNYLAAVNADGSKVVHVFYTIGVMGSNGKYTYDTYIDGVKHTEAETDSTTEIYINKDGEGVLNVYKNEVNYEKPKFDFKVIKKGTENEVLEGVQFKLYSDAGRTNQIGDAEYTNENGVGVFDNLEYNYGDTLDHIYYFAETKTLPGYKLPVDKDKKPIVYKFYAKAKLIGDGKFVYEFYLNDKLHSTSETDATKDVFFESANEKDVTMGMNIINKPNEDYNLNVIKKGDDGKLLAGAEFTVYSDQDCTVQVAKETTDENGKLRLTGFKHNYSASNIKYRYYVKETRVPDNYLAAVNRAGEQDVHEFHTVASMNADGSYTYTIYVDGVRYTEADTDSTKQFYFTKDGEGILSVNMNAMNYKKYPFNFKIVKKNDKGTALEGVEFSLYKDASRTELLSTMKTVADGTGMFDNLEYNYGDTLEHVYYFAETKTLDGYRLPLGEDGKPVLHKFYAKAKLGSDGKFTYSYYLDDKLYQKTATDASKEVFFSDVNEKVITMNMNVVNEIGRKLPETGSSMMFPILGAGVLLMAAALFIGRRKKSKTTKIENEK